MHPAGVLEIVNTAEEMKSKQTNGKKGQMCSPVANVKLMHKPIGFLLHSYNVHSGRLLSMAQLMYKSWESPLQ